MRKHALFSALIALIFACTTMKVENSSARIRLGQVEKIVPGITKKEEIQKLLGNPDNVSDLSENPSLDDNGEVWHYFKDPIEREAGLSLYFQKGAAVVASVGWHVAKGEPEQKLDVAKNYFRNRYQNISFEEGQQKAWGEDAANVGIATYEDPKLGVIIMFQKDSKEVTGLTWSDPTVFSKMAQKWKSRKLSCPHGANCVVIKSQEKQDRTITSPEL